MFQVIYISIRNCEKKDQTVMVNNSTNINKTNNLYIEPKKYHDKLYIIMKIKYKNKNFIDQ
jgi:hypothetical protein